MVKYLTDIKPHLQPKELEIYDSYSYLALADKSTKSRSKELLAILESLAASRASEDRKRALLEKHQWAGRTTVKKVFDDVPHACCLECGWEKAGHRERHAPDCALAAELEGGK